MASQRFNSRELTADHIGRTVTVTWPTAGDGPATHSVTGELESITQDRTRADAHLRVGPLGLSVQFAGPVELHLHAEE